MGDTSIAWTNKTWNPIRGCSRVSEGCRFCYAETFAARFNGPGEPYEGLVTRTRNGARWTGVVREVPEHLEDPLKWRKPRMIFVNSMSDLFHESLSFEAIDKVFAVMAVGMQHTYQVLTKRPERALEYLSDEGLFDRINRLIGRQYEHDDWVWQSSVAGWPLKNVWLGVSVEDQAAADKRIPLLLQTPAAVRWISAEPLLGPVDLSPWLDPHACVGHEVARVAPWDEPEIQSCDGCEPFLNWVVVGGESGPGSRPFNVLWVQQIIRQCREAGVAVFVKQLGAKPVWGPDGARYELRDRKGGDMAEWPEDLRIREWPPLPFGPTRGGADNA